MEGDDALGWPAKFRMPTIIWVGGLVLATVGGTVFLAREEFDMSSKASLTGHTFAIAMAAAGIVAVSVIGASKPSLAQMAPAPAGDTTSLQHGSDAEKALNLKEPSFQTREERLNAKPLDWNSTIGTPTPKVLTPAETEALRRARPATAAGGAPNPKADEEARKLHPDDWK